MRNVGSSERIVRIVRIVLLGIRTRHDDAQQPVV